MKVLIITTGCNPLGGGFSLRVHSLTLMASKIADVSVLSIYDPIDPNIPNVKFYHQPLNEGITSKLKRLTTYYRTDYPEPKIDFKPDIVQIEHPALFGLTRYFPGTPVILDQHNVWWQLETYNMQQGPLIRNLPLKTPLTKWLLNRAKKYELDVLNRSSHIIVCSENDKQEILKECSSLEKRISYIPNCIDVERYKVQPSGKNIVLFMGSLIYYPNIDAIRIICEEIAPRVNAEFHILGGNNINMEIPPNVKLLGHVNDVRPYIERAKVCIAPLHYGSGSRLKILEYMATGKSVVSTTKGAEGLDVEPGTNIIITDDMKIFADSINNLLENKNLCNNIGANARQLISKKYDYKLYVEDLKKIYCELKL